MRAITATVTAALLIALSGYSNALALNLTAEAIVVAQSNSSKPIPRYPSSYSPNVGDDLPTPPKPNPNRNPSNSGPTYPQPPNKPPTIPNLPSQDIVLPPNEPKPPRPDNPKPPRNPDTTQPTNPLPPVPEPETPSNQPGSSDPDPTSGINPVVPDPQFTSPTQLPDDPTLIEPVIEQEQLTAPVFKDPTPETLSGIAKDGYIPDQVLILIEDSPNARSTATEIGSKNELTLREAYRLNSINAVLVVYNIPDSRTVPVVITSLIDDARVLATQPVYLYEGLATSSIQYGVNKINADKAHRISTGNGVRVAVIDTGVDYNHSALSNAVKLRRDFVDKGNGSFTDELHGTSIAGIIASTPNNGTGALGISPDVDIISVRACWSDSTEAKNTICSSTSLAKSIDYSILNSAQVINLSLGGPKDHLIAKMIRKAVEKGVIVVAAAGNGGKNGKTVYPAALGEVIAVTATDAKDNLYRSSTRGSYIDLSAPGVEIYCPAPGNKWHLTSGTSMAAAHVTGAIALLLQQNPALTSTEVKYLLTQSALDLGKPGKDNEYGKGRIDALGALNLLNEGTEEARAN